MIDYLEQLKKDFDRGKLLMECILPDSFDWLLNNGFVAANSLESFTLAAAMYREAWLRKNPKRLQDLLSNPVIDQAKRSEEEKSIKENIAKKMAVYDFLRSMMLAIQ